MKQYLWNELDEAQHEALLRRPAIANDGSLRRSVAAIIERVRVEGDQALYALTEQFDGIELAALQVKTEEFDAAEQQLKNSDREAIRAAAANIEAFHRAQLPNDLRVDTAPGVRCERVSRPIQRVGLYVPAGSAPLPSTALMLGIPARLAACPTRVLCSPVRADGNIDPAVLYAARIAGVTRVYKLGGAQAIAAMAYGTESVPKVDKVFGPGNTWVTEAKAQVDGDPAGAARDFPAGPSEILIIADGSARPDFVASDLLSQAEHGPDSQVLLLTTSAQLGTAVTHEIERQLSRLGRAPTARASLQNSSIIVVDSIQVALAVSNRYGPEHLLLQVDDPRRWLPEITAAGSVFLGPWAPESVGDYCSGTNHVLPTYGYAHRHSSLGVSDFMRAMTVQELSREGLAAIGPIAETLARLEGLDAHAQAVRLRLDALVAEDAS